MTATESTSQQPFTLLAHLHMARTYTPQAIDYDRPGEDLPGRQVDVPKLMAGGVGCIWLSEGAPGEFLVDADAGAVGREHPNRKPATRSVFFGAAGVQRQLRGFDAMRRVCAELPELELVTDTAAMRNVAAAGKIAVLLHTEALMIGDDLAVLRSYYEQGLRVSGLVHAAPQPWIDCDKEQHEPSGLTELGRGVVAEMNRLGMLMDVSHASEQAIQDILAASSSPISASHANVKQLSAISRNLSDATITGIADGGGVIGLHCSSAFVDINCLRGRTVPKPQHDPAARLAIVDSVRAGQADPFALEAEFRANAGPVPFDSFPTVSAERLVDHVDYLVDKAGIEHVGIGTDWQILEDSVDGFASAADVPSFLELLRHRGYSNDAVEKIAGGNFARVMHEVID